MRDHSKSHLFEYTEAIKYATQMNCSSQHVPNLLKEIFWLKIKKFAINRAETDFTLFGSKTALKSTDFKLKLRNN